MSAGLKIFHVATRFRRAIEATPRSNLPIGFANFPYGSCADASIILGEFLFKEGQGNFYLVRGTRGRMDDDTWGSHAWLAQNDWIIDITANQFADVHEPVIVCRDSEWHNQFRVDGVSLAHLDAYDSCTYGYLARAYYSVLATLDTI